ncbi:hypothetical protein GCM10028785_33640 [Hydrogenophaga soli]
MLMKFVPFRRSAWAVLVWMVLSTAHAQPVDANAVADVPQPRLMAGNDAVIAPPKDVPPLQGNPISFNFEDAPIAQFAAIVLKDVLRVDHVLHQPLAGSVTLSTSGEVPADQAMLLLESALQANGLMMVRDTRGTYHVGKPDVLKGVVPALRQATPGKPLPPGTGAIIIRLQYIGAAEMASILKPMMAADSLIRVDTARNLLVLSGTRNQAEGWLEVVSTFDVNLLKGMSVGVFPLKNVTTAEVDTALRLLSGGGAAAARTPATAPAVALGAAGAAASAANTPAAASASDTIPFFGSIRIMPIERINSVIVVTPRAAYLEEARAWIDKLDQPGNGSSEPQLFIYPVQNGSAKHLASVVGGLFGSGQANAQVGTTGVAPGLQTAVGTTSVGGLTAPGGLSFGAGATAGVGMGANQVGAQRLGASAAQAAPTAVTLGGQGSGVRLMADELNNAVLFYGTKADFSKVESVLKRLDVSPVQVLIEASIIEVTLTDDLSYGLQWLFNGGAPGSLNGRGAVSTVAGGALGAAKAGLSYTLTNSAGNVRGVLNALAEKSLVKVISSPSLMVLDNHTATISVGNQQPVKTATTVVTGGTVSESITYKDTGVSLTVKPSVTAGNMVTMDMNQSVTDVGSVDSATGQRAFLQRQINSKVAVRSGDSVVLGGLIRDNATSGSSGIPGLAAIPLIGGLFGTQAKSGGRTELLVVLMPRVVRVDQDVQAISAELRDRMKGLSFTNDMVR